MHKVILINAAGSRTEHEFATLEDAAGSVGTRYPVVFDGKAGTFEFISAATPGVHFVETEPYFRDFSYAHLPERLQTVSKWFYDLAEQIVLNVKPGPMRPIALLDLLRSKDAAVRASLSR